MEMKLYVSKQRPRNFKHLTSFLNKEWAVIPPELCVNLVTTYRKDSVRLNEGPPPNFFSSDQNDKLFPPLHQTPHTLPCSSALITKRRLPALNASPLTSFDQTSPPPPPKKATNVRKNNTCSDLSRLSYC